MAFHLSFANMNSGAKHDIDAKNPFPYYISQRSAPKFESPNSARSYPAELASLLLAWQ
jgi:hypothetical protein